jgi:hypothetical protein
MIKDKFTSEEWCLLGCYAEDTILHSHRRENLKSYKFTSNVDGANA